MNDNNSSYIDGNGNIVITNVTGTSITINPNNSEDIRKLLTDMSAELYDLPIKIQKILEEKSKKMSKKYKNGANLYLTVLAQVNAGASRAKELSFGTTITNLTREIRYFNQPYFKVFPKFKLHNGLEHDTFYMVNNNNATFPIRLEFGQVLNADFPVNQSAFKLYEAINQEDAYIQAFVTTTIGEIYSSRQYPISKFVEEYKQLLM